MSLWRRLSSGTGNPFTLLVGGRSGGYGQAKITPSPGWLFGATLVGKELRAAGQYT